MDEFGIIDLVYTHVVDADAGMTIYKDKSVAGEENDHIVINMLDYNELDWRNVLPVNVNIFVKNNSNGMPRRSVMSTAKTKIRKELLKIKSTEKQYRSVQVQGSRYFDNLKEGFTCINIRILVTTEKNIKELWQQQDR